MSRRRFLEMLPKNSCGAEIGVWKGDFSAEILALVQPRALHLVDPWEKNEDTTNRSSTVTRSQVELDQVYREVVDRFAGRPVIIHRGRSIDVAACWQESLDWVYIDGIHTYEAVSADLAAWWPHLADDRNAMIAGHDTHIRGVWQAVDDFARAIHRPANVIDNNFFIYAKD